MNLLYILKLHLILIPGPYSRYFIVEVLSATEILRNLGGAVDSITVARQEGYHGKIHIKHAKSFYFN